jgi:hypothetical protein
MLAVIEAKAGSVVAGVVIRKIRERLSATVVDDAIRANYENMTLACSAIMRALVAAKLGVEPGDEEVDRFVDGATTDPALVARIQRLFIEGTKSPNDERRRLLALALLGIGASTPERDRIDAAIERLFPEDISLLRDLVRLADDANPVLMRVSPKGEVPFATRDHDGRTLGPCPDRAKCPDAPVYALQSAGCAAIEPAGGLLPTGVENEMVGVTPLRVLPLGRAVLQALESTGVDLNLIGVRHPVEAPGA